MVSAVMSEGELVGAGTERGRQQLMTETDSEHGHLAEESVDDRRRTDDRRRIAGSVREEDAIGIAGEDLGGRCAGRHDLDRGDAGQVSEDRGLHTEVIGHDPLGSAIGGAGEGDLVGGIACDHTDEIDTAGSMLGRCRGPQFRFGRGAECSGHGAEVADVPRESPRVDAGDTGYSRCPQEFLEITLRAPVAAASGEVPDDDSPGEWTAGLVIDGRHPVVADVRIGEGDQLTGIGGVGDDLLVPGERGVEHDLPRCDPGIGSGPDGFALEDGAVGEDQQCFLRTAHRCASPCSTVGTPHRNVWRTLPRTTRPA